MDQHILDTSMKNQILQELYCVEPVNHHMLDRIKHLINGNVPAYIQCFRDELKELRDENAKLKERVKQLEQEAVFHQIRMRQIAKQLETEATRLKPPVLK